MLKALRKISFFGLSDKGLVRENNEDCWEALAEKNLFVLADGMGGHSAGEVASRMACDALVNFFQKRECQDPEKELVAAFHEANRLIYEKGLKDEKCFGMGTTLEALLIHEDRASFAHVGDSRIYHLRESEFKQLSHDQSLVNELVTLGAISKEEAELFPFKHALTQATGTNIEIKPQSGSLPIIEKDLFLICSDGLTNCVTDEELKETLLHAELSLSERASLLLEKAKKGGGSDNITLIIVSVDDLS